MQQYISKACSDYGYTMHMHMIKIVTARSHKNVYSIASFSGGDFHGCHVTVLSFVCFPTVHTEVFKPTGDTVARVFKIPFITTWDL